ncbi:MAG TPA: gliding motility-associated C-terminal domain-containing protein [Hanamia sp.]
MPCVDSIKTVLHSSTSLRPDLPFQSVPTSDNGVVIFQSTPNPPILSFLKFDDAGNPVWAKRVPGGNQNTPASQSFLDIHQTDNQNYILTGASSDNDLCNMCIGSRHLFLDPNGNPIIQVNYLNAAGDTGWQITNSGPHQIAVFAGNRTLQNGGGITVASQDTIGGFSMPNWSYNYSFTNAGSVNLILTNLYVLENNVYVGGTYISKQSPDQGMGIWMLKIDYNSGKLVASKSYSLNNTVPSADSLIISGKGSFATVGDNRFVFEIELLHSGSLKKEIAMVRMDDNLNIINNPIAVSSALSASANAFSLLSRYDNAVYVIPGSNTESYYAFIDTFNNISQEYKVTGSTVNSGQPQFNLKDNGNINIISTVSQNGNFFLQTTDLPPGFTGNTGCFLVTDTTFASYRQITCTDTKLDWRLQTHEDYFPSSLELPVINDVIENNQLICSQQFTCDSLKISGNNNFCLSDSSYLFSATKNNSCFREINWAIDTSLAQVNNLPGDSTISLRFKKPGSAYLHASLGGCGLSDSILITVNGHPPNVSLGDDTTLCPGSIDTLRAGASYQDYLWQDGSTNPFVVIKNPGKYYVTCTDYCNNVSADTIEIKYDDQQLYSGQPIEICQLEEASISANDGFSNYQWQPDSLIEGNADTQQIEVRLNKSTSFTVSAESNSKCIITDTINVVVNNCQNKLYMPNAFTPNNDGINDNIKPMAFGVLENYSFSVYNRFGQLVFHSTTQGKGWDGTINGIAQDSGVYIWYCQYKFAGDIEKRSKGSFVLIR